MFSLRSLLLSLICIALFSCASIPKEAPILSQELGNEIQELENSHIKLVHTFFDLKRENVRTYLNNVWLPRFAEKYFEQEDIKTMWDVIVTEASTEDRLQFIIVTGPELQNELNLQYQNMTQPLDEMESQLTNALHQKYSNTKSINNSLTSFLISASEVDENRQRYLDKVGITKDKISSVIDKTESVTTRMLKIANNTNSGYDDIQSTIETYKQQLNTILNQL
ncbi:MAG: hypothetical protein WB492_03140 [Christiangramia sp.]